jgi:RNA polymerase sigma-70 factor (ECF subfamily)
MRGTTSSSTSPSLIRALRADEGDAWRKLAQIYGPTVYAWCRRAGLNESDVADVAQNVFAAVFRSIKQFRREGPRDTFRGWLWKITRNEVLMLLRRRGKEPQAAGGTGAHLAWQALPEFFASESAPAGTNSDIVSVRRAITLLREEFEPHTWQAFYRATVDGLSAPEVADEVGMTPVAVRQAKHRVLKRLREFLAED